MPIFVSCPKCQEFMTYGKTACEKCLAEFHAQLKTLGKVPCATDTITVELSENGRPFLRLMEKGVYTSGGAVPDPDYVEP